MEVEDEPPTAPSPRPMKDDDDDDAAPPPSGARSAVPGSPLRLYTAHFLLGDGSTEAAGAAAAAACCHQYLYEHPNGLFIVGIAELHTAIQAARSEGVAITRVDFLPSFRTAAAAGGRQAHGGGTVEEARADAAAAGEGGGEEEQEEPPPATAAAPAAPAAPAAKAHGDGGARVAALVVGNRVVAGPRRGRKKGKGDLIVGAGTVLASVGLADGRAFSVACGVAGQVLELNERVAADPSLLANKPTTEGYLAVIQPPRFPNPSKAPTTDDWRARLVPLDDYRRRFGDAAVASLL